MIKNLIILLLIGGLVISLNYNLESKHSLKLYENVALELSDELVKVSRQLNTSSCVLKIITDVSKGDAATIQSLDGPCKRWQSKDEAIACINQQIRHRCGIEYSGN